MQLKLDNVVILKGGERGYLASKNTVLLYCLKGAYDVHTKRGNIKLNTRDILVINHDEEYGWQSDKDSLLFKVTIDEYMVSQSLNSFDYYFQLSSPEHTTRDYSSLRFILDSMVEKMYLDKKTFSLMSLYYMLWEKICEDYVVSNVSVVDNQEQLVQEVTSYIHSNFSEPLSLNQLAENFGFTESKFSRWFKKQTGEKFVDYLRKVRLEHARYQLVNTDYSITDIAFQSGFTSLSVFNRNFLEFFGSQPSVYRRASSDAITENVAKESEVYNFFKDSELIEKRNLKDSRNVVIDSNFANAIPFNRYLVDVMGPVPASQLLESQFQKELKKITSALHARYLIVSNLTDLTTDSNTKVSFDKICLVIESIFSELNLIPVFEINIDFKWQELLSFLELRLTKETLSKCLFKIDYTEAQGIQQFIYLYKKSYGKIRELLPKAVIGLGRIWMPEDADLFMTLISSLDKNELPQFISVACLPYSNSSFKKMFSIGDENYVRYNLDLMEKAMSQLKLDIPMWVEAWDMIPEVGDAYHDSCAKACHVLKQFNDAYGRVEHVCCGRISDWSYLTEKYPYPFFGAGGLVSKDGIQKPIYYALLMNSFMRDYLIAAGDGYMVSLTEDNYYCVLLYNSKKFGSIYYQQEKELRPEMLVYSFENRNTLEFKLQFKNVKPGMYNVASYEVRSDENNVLSEWKNLRYKQVLNVGEIDYITSICNPRMTCKYENVTNGILSLKYVLGPNDFRMILFSVT